MSALADPSPLEAVRAGLAGGRQDPSSQAVESSFSHLLADIDFSFVISNPRMPDNPVCYASPGFYATTGYSPEEIVGRNCRVLQGRDTCRRSVVEIRDALREERPVSVCLLNYRRDGAPFWNCFALHPVRLGGTHEPVDLYIGLQADVTGLVQEGAGASLCTTAAASRAEPRRSADLQAQERGALERGRAIAGRLAAAAAARALPRRATLAAGRSLPSSLLCALGAIRESFLLTDPRLPGGPIVYASPGFLALTGHGAGDVLGRNPRLLQGREACAEARRVLREALARDPPTAATVTLLNRRADGSRWWNCLHIAPLRDAQGAVRYIVGVQVDVTARVRGQEHRAGASGGGAEVGEAAGVTDVDKAAGVTEVDKTTGAASPGGSPGAGLPARKTCAAGGHSCHLVRGLDPALPPLDPDAWHALKARGVAGQVRLAARALGPSGLVRGAVG
ncbi:hypothetical protein ACKKBF_B21015 [Auxenochlorella protothecoides x Auxenochlorella symbiontica]